MKTISIKSLSLLAALLLTPVVQADYSEEELERWFNSDEFAPPRLAAEVNEGKLVFLQQAPANVHHHHNSLEIRLGSLRDGWVRLKQCHENIDRVSSAQILFSKEKVRDLEVTQVRNIGRAWVDGGSVQMSDIGARARLCVTAWTRSLISHGDGSYSLRNGPFMRRFLDGYYPMRVSMEISTGDTGLTLVSVTPTVQQGLHLEQRDNLISIQALFEGRLRTELRFRSGGLL